MYMTDELRDVKRSHPALERSRTPTETRRDYDTVPAQRRMLFPQDETVSAQRRIIPRDDTVPARRYKSSREQ